MTALVPDLDVEVEPDVLTPPPERQGDALAELHHEVGTLIAAATYAVGQLAPFEQGPPPVARALAVLRRALAEVTR